MENKINNINGKRFGKLVAVEETRLRKNGNIIWRCVCDCGKQTMVTANNLKNGNTKSCNCLRREMMSKTMYKHGEAEGDSRTRLYEIWLNMKTRCYNPNNKVYKYYGGRGIKICNAWKDNYSAFRFWAILNGYQDNLTIDRIDSNGNYEPSNCQWLTKSEHGVKSNRERKSLIS